MTPKELEARRKYHREWQRNWKLKMDKEELDLRKEQKCEYDKKYRKENEEKVKANKKEYYEENKEEILKKGKQWVQDNREHAREYRKKWYWDNKEEVLKENSEYYKEHRERYLELDRIRRKNLMDKLYDILGKKCLVCGTENPDFLTIDHINGGGRKEREEKGGAMGILLYLESKGWPEDYIKENYQILCWNHNCGRRREYLDKPLKDLNYQQIKAVNSWKEALDFFGPCEICGETDLKFLTIDHIKGNGTQERINGGKFGVGLIKQFRNLGWPESLKEDYRFLCYNHNCSRGKRCSTH